MLQNVPADQFLTVTEGQGISAQAKPAVAR